jgi:hypothetical protein
MANQSNGSAWERAFQRPTRMRKSTAEKKQKLSRTTRLIPIGQSHSIINNATETRSMDGEELVGIPFPRGSVLKSDAEFVHAFTSDGARMVADPPSTARR